MFTAYFYFIFENSPTSVALACFHPWKKCLEYELCGRGAFEVAPATSDLQLAAEVNICACRKQHTGLSYLKSRLIYNHVHGGQVSAFFFLFFFLHNKVTLRKQDPGWRQMPR